MSYYKRMQDKVKLLKDKKDITILAIETSCDETSAAVVKDGREVLSNIISSQIDIHKIYGGVVPEIASRKHIEAINIVIENALKEASVELKDLDAVAVTFGPGLVGALITGLSVAKALAYGLDLPLIGVHHIEGHISANYISHKELEPPFVCLVVSGGHTQLVHVKDYGKYEIVGQTRDDAAGEAFDKIARTLELGYPGGPAIDKLAKKGDSERIVFPKSNIKDNPFDFSFSGLKTAVINYIHNAEQRNEPIAKEDIAAGFQKAVVDVLAVNTINCALDKKTDKIIIAGGVAANSSLRNEMEHLASENNMKLYYPSMVLCTDNAAMIGCAAYYKLLRGEIDDLTLNAVPYLSITDYS